MHTITRRTALAAPVTVPLLPVASYAPSLPMIPPLKPTRNGGKPTGRFLSRSRRGKTTTIRC